MQGVYAELNALLGDADECEAVKGTSPFQSNAVTQLEVLLDQITAIGNVDGLSTSVAAARSIIEKAFAARSAFKQHLESMDEGADVSVASIREAIAPQLRNAVSVMLMCLLQSTELFFRAKLG